MVVSLLFEDCLSPGGYVRRESPQDTKKLTASERRVLEFDVEGVGAEATTMQLTNRQFVDIYKGNTTQK